MTHDQNKKTLRHFQCRDYLWELFEQMSQELECSTDYLINEAMRQYARSRNYGTRGPSVANMRAAAGSGHPTIPPLRSRPPQTRYPSSAPPPPPPPRSAPAPGYQSSYPPDPQTNFPPSRGFSPAGGGGGYPPPGYGSGYPAPNRGGGYPPPRSASYPPQRPAYSSSVPPPLPGASAHGPAPGLPPLFILFNGQKIAVNKAEFVIGRGSKTSDLPIKDGNISRRHAAVVYENGSYVFKDLGSTNGVEFAGQRIDRKPIHEGDVFQLCDYELRFTFR